MADNLALADMCEELIAEPLALARSLDEPSDIDELDASRDSLLGVVHFRELIETLVRNRHNADIRLNRRERIIRGERVRVRQGIKQCGFADVR